MTEEEVINLLKNKLGIKIWEKSVDDGVVRLKIQLTLKNGYDEEVIEEDWVEIEVKSHTFVS